MELILNTIHLTAFFPGHANQIGCPLSCTIQDQAKIQINLLMSMNNRRLALKSGELQYKLRTPVLTSRINLVI